MNVDQLRKLCLSFPGATEQIQWGYDLVFKVGGKMFAITPLEPAPVCLSFKVTPENFTELTERGGVIPAPYLARAQWIALESREALSPTELTPLLREAYELVRAKLPRKLRDSLERKVSAPEKKLSHAVRASKSARRTKRRS